jgi:hypothetical protein
MDKLKGKLLDLWGLGWVKFLVFLVPALLLCWSHYHVYSLGVQAGDAKARLEWATEREGQQQAIQALHEEIGRQERAHSEETTRISNAATEERVRYEGSLAALDRTYAERLRNSEDRARRYASLADSGAASCRSLATRTAELDASLEQGRRVVEELRATVELRDTQLRLLYEQLQADRQLIGQRE